MLAEVLIRVFLKVLPYVPDIVDLVFALIDYVVNINSSFQIQISRVANLQRLEVIIV